MEKAKTHFTNVLSGLCRSADDHNGNRRGHRRNSPTCTTDITIVDGVYYAAINSLINSGYTLIYYSDEFPDTYGYRAETAINNMPSRKIISEYQDCTFIPNGGNYQHGVCGAHRAGAGTAGRRWRYCLLRCLGCRLVLRIY